MSQLAITDSSGALQITGLQVGTYDLLITATGYKSQIISDVSIQTDQIQDLGTITLELEDIAVVGSSLGYDFFKSEGTPDDSIGNQGDVYLDMQTLDIYQKGSSAWELTGNLIGEQGLQGITGNHGTVIYNGTDTPTSGIGIDSDYYFNTSEKSLYQKQYDSWAFLFFLSNESDTATLPAGP